MADWSFFIHSMGWKQECGILILWIEIERNRNTTILGAKQENEANEAARGFIDGLAKSTRPAHPLIYQTCMHAIED